MSRAIAIISCLIATLFLGPGQGDCSEIPEYELETEIECCAVVSGLSQSQVTEKLPKSLPAPYSVRRHIGGSVKIQKHVFHLPARILNCVFRE